MALSNEEAEALLKLEKILETSGQVIDLNQKKNRLELIAKEDTSTKFWVEVTSNHIVILKTSIHHLEANTHIGLLRIDFRGTHQNPIEVIDTLPHYLYDYAGKFFSHVEPHVHLYVEGYKPLVWAMPLQDYDFQIKNLESKADVSSLIYNFAKKINISSNITIIGALDLG